ncbi:aspartic proteinase 39-like isoform X4 [Oryza glaberrima]|uniref:aspartic proteinase 39-like isoform X4 n=1 Tax=Oryza glaberrima TaxID=4538 RepID=UPI00224BF888|nr:aspartic proteinase 39-like isoform X4 [Oryza glaberrima]
MAAPLLLSTIISALVVVASSTRGTMANGVFQVRRKFHIVDGVYKGSDIGALQTHDGNRHRRRNLMAAELPLGGFSIPYGTGLYYTDIGIGTPAVKYYVQVDTGSEAFWVNGISCKQCPHESDILRKLTFYDPRSSVSSKEVKCDDTICTSRPPCNMTLRCPYIAVYSDGGLTMGILFTDLLHYHQLYGNGQTQPTSTSVTFGCGLQQTGSLNNSELAIDGIIGFGNSNQTLLSQLAAAGKTKKIFSHCLDSTNGGGIFAIGEVVEPKVKTTPIVKNNVDDKFPKITFNFENDLTLDVYPYDYLLEYEGNQYCFGFQDAGKQGHKDKILLGDMVISNKVVVYDMEKQAIGWTEHNCSSSIKIKDEKTGATYTVQADNISSGWTIQWQMPLVLLLVTKVSNYLLSKLCMVYNINSVLTQLLGL